MEESPDSDLNTISGIVRSKFVQKLLLFSSLAAVAVGTVISGIMDTFSPLSNLDRLYMGLPGELLLRMLQAVVVCLIVTSVITGIAGLNTDINAKIARRAAMYFILTTLMSVCVGLVLVLVIEPGFNFAVGINETEDEKMFFSSIALMDLVRNMLPLNLVQACYQKYETHVQVMTEVHDSNSTSETNVTEVELVGRHVNGVNTMGLIVSSTVFGVVLRKMGDRGKILVDIFTILYGSTQYVVNLILCYLPVGVLFLVASHVYEDHGWEIIYQLAMFVAVVIVGLIIHAAVVLPMVCLLWGRRNPYTVIKTFLPALQTAIRNSSSSATLPLTLQCCEERSEIDSRIARFMLPIGTNVNMNGTVLYEVVSAVFVAQLNHIHLDLIQLITIGVTAAVSCTGAAGLPARGAVTSLFVLTAVGLPAEEASILLVFECLLDHLNTVVNLLGDCFGVAIVHQLSKKELEEMEQQNRDRQRVEASGAERQDGDIFYDCAEDNQP